jgi:aerobic-type carbon monoxide dehydrogenase small subunit (CoxS/CutS family)
MGQIDKIETRIFTIRGLQVMLDRDLAELYQVPVKVLNQAVKRNINRFPERFRFQLNKIETDELVTNCDRFKSLKHSSVLPYVFAESGVAMLSTVLRSTIAVSVSVKIMDAFVAMRKILSAHTGIIQRLETVEQKQIETDKKVDKIFNALESKDDIPKCGVFFDGQIFDAYALVNKIIKSAKQSIVLIDNYIDESVLTMLGKKSKNVKVTLLTKDISKQLNLDISKFNQQYPTMEAKNFSLSHDRFLIIDGKEVYHLGASLKDLGKKWFAFSKMEMEGLALLEKIEP